ncbi:hypothetical protein GII30_21420 [Gordonia amarae]|uniref:Uncharacterized protein n=1 Tax=Gordonia amarae TaxID=36821 RepID=A0A857KPX5_9ACTN|nr:hypothetical protein [Gordonia amarae]MCS3881006.1 hypothetical protein [Gordonia amarae]QHN19242.1 hypothetical protein GII35_21715 [Gordonia amarae]QHN23718.1 hypothetical protein GII34_21215 [Gordonia amarae]QHN32630.1 hypothetical protein GII32_21545 [Gordonia amarae]QHN41378.1 hypothetical protein GII30_21420 [Gordonia amarae]
MTQNSDDDNGHRDSGQYRVPPENVRHCARALPRSGRSRWRFAPVVCPHRAA